VVPAGQFGGRASTGGTASGSAVAGSAAYFQGLALQKLGQADRAKTLFQQLLDTGTQALASRPVPANTATVPAGARSAAADAFCLSALGNLGLGNKDQARQQLTNALKISPDHLAAKLALANLAQ
jgi:tetratricopeptide (TPR) repeat protein